MSKIAEHLAELSSTQNIRFERLLIICRIHFEEHAVKGSHHRFRTPWKGDPRINLQEGKGGKAKPYQVQQVRKALNMKAALPGEASKDD